jgi:hypothetical protein
MLTTRLMMTSRATGALALAAVLLGAAPAEAQRRELQQMAADLRILQEQTQLLQNAVTTRDPQRLRRSEAPGRCGRQ